MKTSEINRKLNPFDMLFLLRPPMLIPVWAFFLAGYWRSSGVRVGEIGGFVRGALAPNGYFWLSFAGFSLLMGSVYIINQIVDRVSDRVNRKLFLIPLGIVPLKLAYTMVLLLFIIAFIAGWCFGLRYMMLLMLSFVLGVSYSIPPFRMKGRPILDVASNAIGYGLLAFGIGWITKRSFEYALLVYAIPYLFAAATIFCASTILDIDGDRQDGAVTTAVMFGRRTTLVVSLVSLLIALGSAAFLKDYVIVITSLLGLPLLILALIKGKRQFVTLYMRGTSYIFIVLMGLLFPWFFALVLLVFLASKYYYRWRFGLTYPKLLEKGT